MTSLACVRGESGLRELTQTPLASIETDLFAALSGFHQKVMTLLRKTSLDDEKLNVVAERIKALLDNATADVKQAKELKLAERLEGG